jgi:uncharacterized protein
VIYLDSAIVLKLFVNETDSDQWRSRIAPLADLCTSSLVFPEVKCALRRKVQSGFLNVSGQKRVWQEFQQLVETGAIQVFPIGADVIDTCMDLLDELQPQIGLRTLDAIHLATARLIQTTAVATADARMRDGASALRIPVM